jgi:hypothetical protein
MAQGNVHRFTREVTGSGGNTREHENPQYQAERSKNNPNEPREEDESRGAIASLAVKLKCPAEKLSELPGLKCFTLAPNTTKADDEDFLSQKVYFGIWDGSQAFVHVIRKGKNPPYVRIQASAPSGEDPEDISCLEWANCAVVERVSPFDTTTAGHKMQTLAKWCFLLAHESGLMEDPGFDRQLAVNNSGRTTLGDRLMTILYQQKTPTISRTPKPMPARINSVSGKGFRSSRVSPAVDTFSVTNSESKKVNATLEFVSPPQDYRGTRQKAADTSQTPKSVLIETNRTPNEMCRSTSASPIVSTSSATIQESDKDVVALEFACPALTQECGRTGTAVSTGCETVGWNAINKPHRAIQTATGATAATTSSRTLKRHWEQ